MSRTVQECAHSIKALHGTPINDPYFRILSDWRGVPKYVREITDFGFMYMYRGGAKGHLHTQPAVTSALIPKALITSIAICADCTATTVVLVTSFATVC